MTGRSLAERVVGVVNRVGSGPEPPLSTPLSMRPPAGRWFNWAHYGVMVPNLPEPHRYFGIMAIVGTPEVTVFANDHVVAPTPRHHPEVGVELSLRATGTITITHFFDIPGLYWHWSLLCEYDGVVGDARVSGLCALEYACGAGPHSLLPPSLATRAKVPARVFTYQIVNVDDRTQVLLTHVSGPFGIPVIPPRTSGRSTAAVAATRRAARSRWIAVRISDCGSRTVGRWPSRIGTAGGSSTGRVERCCSSSARRRVTGPRASGPGSSAASATRGRSGATRSRVWGTRSTSTSAESPPRA